MYLFSLKYVNNNTPK